jgi:hypothetical protein
MLLKNSYLQNNSPTFFIFKGCNYKSIIKSILILFFAIILNNIIYAQTSCPNKIPYVNVAIKAMAFYEGVRYNVEKISAYKSQSTNELQMTLLRFEIRFKSARDSAANVLKSNFKDYNESLFFTENFKLIDSFYLSVKLDEYSAIKYKNFIEKCLDGTNTSKDFDYLLSFKFKGNPIDEFNSGHTSIYSTLNHNKAKGTNWKIKYPKSWICMEADRPNIITKIINDFGNGPAGIALAVKDLSNITFSNADLESFFNEKSAKEMMPPNSKFILYKKLVIESLPAGKSIYITEMQRMDIIFKIYTVNYSFIYKSKLYNVICTISLNSQQAERDIISIFTPLFDMVFNSVVLADKYN